MLEYENEIEGEIEQNTTKTKIKKIRNSWRKKRTDKNHQNTNNRLTLFYGFYLFCAVSVYDCAAKWMTSASINFGLRQQNHCVFDGGYYCCCPAPPSRSKTFLVLPIKKTAQFLLGSTIFLVVNAEDVRAFM